MVNVPKLFGELVFNETVMKEKLPTATYKAYKAAILTGKNLDLPIANIIANAMKDWALEQGATHFSHWFQPMTGITAEKHESFITPTADGRIIMDFSGKELIQGEPDASSFPSGGLRATFEARGYTAWDPTSYAFIKDNTLCIPTAFCSYTGEILDKKTPLLRSMYEIDMAARRILKIFGTETEKVVTTVGPEQEYFLIDKAMWEKRRDLVFTGRTLLGAMPPKGQEMEDHYFGIIKPRVKAFMAELDEELWKLGVLAKTEHNEVAPAQHELAPIFTTTNVATDHNQLTMEFMKRIALRHGLVCLLHEKPFDGINGSGKHNNWSIATSEGENLLDPGAEPQKDLRFLVFLTAIIKAVDVYQDMLRVSVATPGNDHRLGANEAPPAIISIFLGTELTNVLDAIEKGVDFNSTDKKIMEIGGNIIPHFVQDNTDRNRTSPFAFTGNKFEFRAVGSTQSISGPNIVLNTAVADILDEFADKIEKASNKEAAIKKLIRETVVAHKRIVFNGDGYTDAWVKEAKKRGLLNLKSTPEALPYMLKKKNLDLFAKHHIFTEAESRSRVEILLEDYAKVINIEAKAMIEMLTKDLLPAASCYTGSLANTIASKKAAGISTVGSFEIDMVKKLTGLTTALYKQTEVLQKAVVDAGKVEPAEKAANAYHDKVFTAMSDARKIADELEALVDDSFLPYPTYGSLLFGVNC
ncbi:Glutamine synthetase [bioreactor metagenome]|uniref:Glutamine synthetase n=1 Tax=bioreactor metagenome TaxID=1076179 RepID=A0A644VDQ1_9ZZZZ|nr:glutamine synthetase III [Acidaminococcaceae bacterium]NLU44533.1 glutamine synthetase type III [Acholeplasmataceae bacterium]